MMPRSIDVYQSAQPGPARLRLLRTQVAALQEVADALLHPPPQQTSPVLSTSVNYGLGV